MRPSLLVLGLIACSPSPDDTGDPAVPDALAATTALPAGDPDCQHGGTRVDVGLDDGEPGGTNGDGVLQAEEIDQTTLVCADAPDAVHAVVTATIDLQKGDPDCPPGGHRVTWGLDDGLPSGTADDAVLQDDEIDGHAYLCFDEVPVTIEEVFAIAPDDTAGTLAIDLSGGDGPSAGAGGNVRVEAYGGPLPTAIILRPDAAPTFIAPTPGVVVDLGAVPAQVTTDLAMLAWDGNGEHPAVLHSFGGSLYLGAQVVTGLHVHPGATLTMPQGQGSIRVDADVHNEGTITTFLAADVAGALTIECDDFVNAVGGVIDLKAKVRAGHLEIVAAQTASSSIVNLGDMRTNGQNGALPGRAGGIELIATGDLYQHGDLIARGGTSGTAANPGEPGGRVLVWSLGGIVSNTGEIRVEGGDGSVGGKGGDATVRGGSSAYDRELPPEGLDFATFAPGLLVQTGSVDASGGDGVGSQGGAGGTVLYDTRGGWLHLGGSVDASGGTGTDGGDGGDVIVVASPHLEGADIGVPSDLTVAAAIDAAGGDGTGEGGPGGSVRVALDVSMTKGGLDQGGPSVSTYDPLVPSDAHAIPLASLGGGPVVVTLAGYGGGFDLGGGSGEYGADAGRFDAILDTCYGAEPACAIPTLGARWIRVDVPLDVTGGSGPSLGGAGGYVTLGIDDRFNSLDAVADAARIDWLDPTPANGGSAPDGTGGVGGEVSLSARQGDLVIGGGIEAVAGPGCPACTEGSPGGTVRLTGWRIDVDGDVDVRGAVAGGSGGEVAIDATTLDLAGDILAWGGDTPDGVDRNAGSGGSVRIGADVAVAGDIRATGGAVLGGDDARGGYGGSIEVTARRATLGAVDVSSGDVLVSADCVAQRGGWLMLHGTESLTVTGPASADGGACPSGGDGPNDARGGNGGDVMIFTTSVVGALVVTADGGEAVAASTAVAEAGGGGWIEVSGLGAGSISARGGVASGDQAVGGPGGNVFVGRDNAVLVRADGGDGSGGTAYTSGGKGGSVQILADNTGEVSATGGDATSDDAYPGEGGWIEVLGDNSACLDVASGAGGTVGGFEVIGVDTGTCE